MPESQATKINAAPNDWDDLLRQLNFIISDIYFQVDQARGLAGESSIALDTFASPTDNTKLNADTVAHGLMAKLDGVASHVWSGIGTWIPQVTGSGVVGPAGAVSSNLVEFDGITGLLIKDGGITHAFILARAPSASPIFTGAVKISGIKSGATQAAAGAAISELWRTSGHATLPDGVVMIGI